MKNDDERKQWEKPLLTVVSSVSVSDNVLWASPGGSADTSGSGNEIPEE